jgi:hypothetical protein
MPQLMRERLRLARQAAARLRGGEMMQQAAEQLLSDVLSKYGSAACDTPQMLEMLLRKHGRTCPGEVEVMAAALRCGIVKNLRSEKGADPTSLARLLVLDTRVSQAQAEWAVAAWSNALTNAPTRVSSSPAGNSAPLSGSGNLLRTAVVLALAGATGAIAYLAFGQ